MDINEHSVRCFELPTILPGVTGTPPMVVGTLLILESKLCTIPQLFETAPVVMLIIRVLSNKWIFLLGKFEYQCSLAERIFCYHKYKTEDTSVQAARKDYKKEP